MKKVALGIKPCMVIYSHLVHYSRCDTFFLDRPDLVDDVLSQSYEGSTAWVGKGSVTVESVRMIKDDGADDPPVID